MSSIAQTAARRVATLQIPRTLAASAPRAAAFSTSVQLQKSAAETAKDALKTVDRAVSDKLVDGINIGSTVAQKAKEVTEDIVPGTKNTGAASEVSGQASGKASELSGKASGKASELSGKASGKASELAGKAQGAQGTTGTTGTAGEAKGKADELIGEAKGKASELAGKTQGKANELAGKAKGTAEEVSRKM